MASNIISGNGGDGIRIEFDTAIQNVIENNVIGLDSSGRNKLPNKSNGVEIVSQANDNTIGGSNDQRHLGNVISGNTQNGVRISGSDSNQVFGNNIGVASDGVTPLGNSANGVKLENDASSNQIGEWVQGSKPFTNLEDTGNVISGNGQDGVLVTAPGQQNFNSMNNIAGNSIGIGVDGTTKVQNGQNGVEINQVIGIVVSGNVISGNNWNGVAITGDPQNPGAPIATQAAVTHNLIGTNAAGNAPVGNGQNGIYVYAADQNTIGGMTGTANDPAVPSNVISGNNLYGIEIGGSSNLVVNNYIGTDFTGMKSIRNLYAGVNIGYSPQIPTMPITFPAADNTIGGTGGINSTLNLISGNTANGQTLGYGISMEGAGVTGTLIEGNYIGVAIDGTTPLGNSNSGVYINNAAGNGTAPTNTIIGGAAANAGNVISANGTNANGRVFGYGVDAEAGTGQLQNNYVGYDVNGGNLKNQKGGENLPGIGWTSNEKKPPQ